MSDTETLEQVRLAGRRRLCPSLTNPNWLILRQRRLVFQRWLQRIPSKDLHVLDVGGRIQPYRPLLEGVLARYVAIDLRVTPLVDVVAQAEKLPLAGEQFDLVLCTQVLEYVPDPRLVIAEIYRVLKPGGFLLLSAPAVWLIDSENECWRFLPAGLRFLLSRFASVDIAPEGNSLIGFIRTVNVFIATFAKPAALSAMLQYSLVPILNIAGTILERVLPSTNYSFSANFSVLAQK